MSNVGQDDEKYSFHTHRSGRGENAITDYHETIFSPIALALKEPLI